MKYSTLALVLLHTAGHVQARCGFSKNVIDQDLPDFVTMVPPHQPDDVSYEQAPAPGERELTDKRTVEFQGRTLQDLVGDPITEAEVRALFSLWDNTLATGDSRIVATRYAEDAVLLPTVSDEVRTDFEGIKDYFDKFLAGKPKGEIVEGHIKIGNGWATDVGIYQFTMGTTGQVVKARYSYFYEPDENGNWMIQHHHSSMMPEDTAAARITEDEVRALFGLWNDALGTLDPKEVALRYSENAVLLPTMSDTSRTDFCKIEDYFIHFLKHEPKGEIIESHVMIGVNWAQDVGVYEFTMGTTGKKVRGRYSFIYVYENDNWMISHHHSSVMPESIVTGEPITILEVRGLSDLWNDALKTLDPYTVARRYSMEGTLLPTLSDKPRNTFLEIADYFINFLKYEPVGEILEGDITIGTNWAQDAGIYEFTMGTTGAKVKGRYTFVYVFENGEWKISQHHSSMMPEGVQPESITEQEVKNLFQLWNSALLIEDPDAVARRYSKNAVLLPTVSDTPRTDYALIKDYFVNFLEGRPSGAIIESYVNIGHNWCSDVGIYEFTMRKTGDKVRGRYSFVYIWEDGQWMIDHHHSSKMPEALTSEASSSPTITSTTSRMKGTESSGLEQGGDEVGGAFPTMMGVVAAAGFVIVGAAVGLFMWKRNQASSGSPAAAATFAVVENPSTLEEDKLVLGGEQEIAQSASSSVGDTSNATPVCLAAKSLYISNEEDSA